jgi:hypothetical protein
MESSLRVLKQLIDEQQQKLEACARRIRPNITAEDLLQPNDYPELELHPYFRHEEGILDGLRMAHMALSSRA